MSAQILDGIQCAEHFFTRMASQVDRQRPPGLAVILVGHHPASQVYVRRKRETCERLGFRSFSYDFDESISTDVLLQQVEELNQDPRVHGILIQLPLPAHMDSDRLIKAIKPEKDVDGFHPANMGLLALNQPGLRPCTPQGVMALLEHHQLSVKGLNALVIGASRIVGRPMALELLNAGATVTVAHSKTRQLDSLISQADVVVAAVGRPGALPSSALKYGVIAIDVGFTRTPEGKILGDLDADLCHERASWYTPVPGGVGPMTIAMLMHNTLQAAGGI